MQKSVTSKVSFVVFVITLVVVGLNYVSLFFPALIVTSITDFEGNVDPLEPGVWVTPILIANISIFCFFILYYKQKLPNLVLRLIKFILNFEVSKKWTMIVIVIILGGYIAFTVGELDDYEGDIWTDFSNIEKMIEEFPFVEGIGNLPVVYVQNFLLYTSHTVFHNVKVIPFVASISLLLLTYFFTVKICNKRFSGVVAMLVLLQSHTFLRYDTVASYSYFWVLFYLLSLYLVYKKWYLSHIAFILSIFSKLLTLAFLPMVLFFAYRVELAQKNKIRIIILYIVIIGTITSILFVGIEAKILASTAFDYVDFWNGFTTLSYQLRFDVLVVLFLLPLVVCLFLKSRNGTKIADSISILIMGVLLSVPLLAGFTNYDTHQYRYVPLLVFFAVGAGVLFAKNHSNRLE